MSIPYNGPKWSDGGWRFPIPSALPEFSAPIPGVATNYLLTQKWQQSLNGYNTDGPLALNTAHPDYGTYYLVSETPKQDIGGGNVEFTRNYLNKPATHTEYSTLIYSFIGFLGVVGINVQPVTGRLRVARPALAKIVFDYFWIAAAGDYTTADNIPVTNQTKYYDQTGSVLEVDYLRDSPPYTVATVPSLTTYNGWVASPAWQIVAEPSSITRYMGTFFQRKTIYIQPQ